MAQRSSKGNKILITVNVVGSPGPIRLLVNSDDSVATVIRRVLKEYGRQRRLPVLGDDPEAIYLCCATFDRALSLSVAIGSIGCRRFSMIKKVNYDGASDEGLELSTFKKRQPKDRFRLLISKSLNLISIATH